MKTYLLVVSLGLCCACRPTTEPGIATDTTSAAARPNVAVVRREGIRLLAPNGTVLLLRGVAFGNEVWSQQPLPPTTHHTEVDYGRVADMGMNAVRFYLNYQLFEDGARPYTYKQTGWAWLDQNVAWAKKHGVYLILNMHVPQGGFQSLGEGGALWTNPENQKRLTSLWQAIAKRYATEPTIAGYDLLNEPVTTQSIDQWKNLAQQLANAIRQVDRNHLIVVERLNAINRDYKDVNGQNNLFLINDQNALYQFHTYDPYSYTHQLLDFAKTGDGGKYPDADVITLATNTRWFTAVFDNPKVVAGTSGWRYYEGVRYKVADPALKIAMPVLETGKLGAGSVQVDDIEIAEYDATGTFVRKLPLPVTNLTTDWYFWSSNNSGAFTVAPDGHTDGQSLRVSGTTADANIGNFAQKFVPKQGYSYAISGWLKGTNLPSDATARLRIDFETTDQPVLVRDKAYLARALQPFADWGTRNKVPVFMGEFGVGRPCFADGKGGLQWVGDMIDIAKQNGFHFTYHVYHEDHFGIYPGYGRVIVPAEGNQALIDLFRQKLK